MFQDNGRHTLVETVADEIWGLEPPEADTYDESDVAIYTTDGSGWITYYNESAARLWGRRPVIGLERWCGSWRSLDASGRVIPPESHPLALALSGAAASRAVAIAVERPDGSLVVVMHHPTPLVDGNGRIVAVSNVMVPVAETAQDKARESQARRPSPPRQKASATKATRPVRTIRPTRPARHH